MVSRDPGFGARAAGRGGGGRAEPLDEPSRVRPAVRRRLAPPVHRARAASQRSARSQLDRQMAPLGGVGWSRVS
jgi:hypothetical protein